MIIYDMTLYWRLLAYALLVGAALGALYDLFRISRLFLSIPTKILETPSQDTSANDGTAAVSDEKSALRGSSKSTKHFKKSRNSRKNRSFEKESASLNCANDSIESFGKIQQCETTATRGVDSEASGKAKKIVKVTNDAVIFAVALIEDIAFFIISAAATSIFLYNLNTGSVRLFLILGIAVGFSAYFFSVGKLTWMIGGSIVAAVRFIVRAIAKLLVILTERFVLPPALFVLSICTKLFRNVNKLMKKLWKISFGKISEKRIERRKAIEREKEEERRREEALCAESERLALEARRVEERIQRKNRAKADGFSYSSPRRA